MDADVAANAQVCAEVFVLVCADVKSRVARVRWAVVLALQIETAHNEPCTAMTTRPSHGVKLDLHAPRRSGRTLRLQRLQVFECVRRVQDGAHHVPDVPHDAG
eukprot:6183639-Pleurochrysis_carterae.AAC.1